MNPDLILLILSSTLLILGVIAIYLIHSQQKFGVQISPPSSSVRSLFPLISVIIPARDEARNIQRCISALQAQTYPNLELIVVNDRSTDATARILDQVLVESRGNSSKSNSPPVSVIQGAILPPGWAGKPHALHQGYSIARGEWLCFIDADTFAAPELLSSTYQAANTSHAGLFTIVTNQELVTFWEKVILPLVFTALSVGFPPDRVNDPGKPDAIANGQFLLFRRSVYEAVGGHQAVRAQIAEDKALAELVKRGGFGLLLADGRQLARTRMYTSLPEIWEGWTKNMYIGLQDRLWLLGIGVAVGMSGAVILPLWLILSLMWLAAGGGWVAALVVTEALLVWGYLIYQRSKINRAMHVPFFYAFSLPIGASIFTAMMVTSAFIVSSGKGVKWRGRTYH